MVGVSMGREGVGRRGEGVGRRGRMGSGSPRPKSGGSREEEEEAVVVVGSGGANVKGGASSRGVQLGRPCGSRNSVMIHHGNALFSAGQVSSGRPCEGGEGAAVVSGGGAIADASASARAELGSGSNGRDGSGNNGRDGSGGISLGSVGAGSNDARIAGAEIRGSVAGAGVDNARLGRSAIVGNVAAVGVNNAKLGRSAIVGSVADAGTDVAAPWLVDPRAGTGRTINDTADGRATTDGAAPTLWIKVPCGTCERIGNRDGTSGRAGIPIRGAIVLTGSVVAVDAGPGTKLVGLTELDNGDDVVREVLTDGSAIIGKAGPDGNG